MTPQTQECPVHAPERGEVGDCYRAAIACLADIPLAEFPHFARDCWPDMADSVRAINAFLAQRGLALLHLQHMDFDAMRREEIGNFYHLIFGIDAEGDGHACVGLNGQIVHDPHPLRRGLANDPSEWTFGLLLHTVAMPDGEKKVAAS